jgi:hypothetical protein
MWSKEAEPFWNQPELSANKRLFDVIQSVFPTFATVSSLHGSTEANRLESNLLDQMGTYIQDRLDAIAQSKGIARSALIRGFGAGKYPDEQAGFERNVAEHLRQEYAKIAPQALNLLRTEGARYQSRYGDIINRLPDLERQRNALDYVKAVAALLIAVGVALVLLVPRYRKHATSYLFIATPVVLAQIFVLVPAGVALYLSMTG